MKSHYLMYKKDKDAIEWAGGVDLIGEHSAVQLEGVTVPTLTIRGLDAGTLCWFSIVQV